MSIVRECSIMADSTTMTVELKWKSISPLEPRLSSIIWKGRPLHACSEGDIGPCLGVSSFPVVKGAPCA